MPWRRWRAAYRDSSAAFGIDVAVGVLPVVLILGQRLAVGALGPGQAPLATTAALLIGAGLALRRRSPLVGCVTGGLGIVVDALTAQPSLFAPYANLITVYSVGSYATRTRAWIGLAVEVVGIGAYFTASPAPARDPAGVLLWWVLAWTIGYTGARRRESQAVARRLLLDQAVADERIRIARELHDLIGHTVNLMLVQAGAARRVMARDVAQSQELLTSLEQTGRGALGELDRVLGIMRAEADTADLPGLAQLPDLARRMTNASLLVTVDCASPLPALPRSLDVSAYRIVQEALTNAFTHGAAEGATVTVRSLRDELELDVTDNGRGPTPGYARGRGLLGMAERAALFGGHIEHGPADGGGFRIRALLPVPPVEVSA